MIHLLEVGPEHTPKEVKKLLRRYAMTGGVEIGLRSDLSAEDLKQIAKTFLPVLNEEPLGSARRIAHSAYRILTLVRNRDPLAEADRRDIDTALAVS